MVLRSVEGISQKHCTFVNVCGQALSQALIKHLKRCPLTFFHFSIPAFFFLLPLYVMCLHEARPSGLST